MRKIGMYFMVSFGVFILAQMCWTIEANDLVKAFSDSSKYWGHLFTISGLFGFLGSIQLMKGKQTKLSCERE